MQIPSYQIHNVLKAYSRQLHRNQGKSFDQKLSNISEGTRFSDAHLNKRKSIIEKVTTNIVDKITDYNSPENGVYQPYTRFQKSADNVIKNSPAETFTFNEINQHNEKNINKICVENPKFLMQRFEKLLQTAAEERYAQIKEWEKSEV